MSLTNEWLIAGSLLDAKSCGLNACADYGFGFEAIECHNYYHIINTKESFREIWTQIERPEHNQSSDMETTLLCKSATIFWLNIGSCHQFIVRNLNFNALLAQRK